MAKAKTRSSRLERAHEIRDAAVRIVKRAGREERIGPTRARVLDHGRFSILYRSEPFPVSEELVAEGISAEEQRAFQGDFGIEMWVDGKKVLNVHWSDGAALQVSTFRRGDWEEALLALGSSPERRAGKRS